MAGDPYAGLETLSVQRREGILLITLDRPDSLNAIDEAMTTELQQVLKAADRDEAVRCVVITGAGRGFCSGQDLGDLSYEEGSPPSFGEELRRRYNPLIRRIRTLEKPVVAAVNGVAAGAGASLALASDLRIASEEASFVEAFVRVGLIPDSGGTFILPLLVGMARAAEMAFTGRKVDAAEALEWGLVNRVVAPAELMDETMTLASELADLPTKAIGLTKRAFNRKLMPDLETDLEYEAYLQEIAGRTEDHTEGVEAFLEKRKPEFKGT